MRRNTLVMVMLAVIALPAVAEEEKAGKGKAKKGGRNVATQILKQLADVDLTDEQTEKIKAAGKVASVEMAKIRDEAGITGELMKKRAEAAKSLADSDKKGKQRNDAINEAAGLTKPQAEDERSPLEVHPIGCGDADRCAEGKTAQAIAACGAARER
ncbi:hypothetical protein [Rosistilla oblonga]|uniref:LTXXQ motif protein n=1 Tax=Rosistilla oblonga TaxID=2527990 RepID=A0A518IW00_9BACT|nr:hypothetical protein [Rosistilla oblonga]QDV57259.1 hypothetical protein Mal33_32630 [Rosistilla oblonga]